MTRCSAADHTADPGGLRSGLQVVAHFDGNSHDEDHCTCQVCHIGHAAVPQPAAQAANPGSFANREVRRRPRNRRHPIESHTPAFPALLPPNSLSQNKSFSRHAPLHVAARARFPIHSPPVKHRLGRIHIGRKLMRFARALLAVHFCFVFLVLAIGMTLRPRRATPARLRER